MQAKGAVGKRAADDSRRARCRYRTCPVSRPQQLAATVRRAILGRMLGWVAFAIAGSLAAAAALVLSGVVRIHRYSPARVDGRLAVAGRGLFFSRTPDGVWWRMRLRPCRRVVLEDREGWGEPPPAGGVREPRRPLGPPPGADQIALDEPGR